MIGEKKSSMASVIGLNADEFATRLDLVRPSHRLEAAQKFLCLGLSDCNTLKQALREFLTSVYKTSESRIL